MRNWLAWMARATVGLGIALAAGSAPREGGAACALLPETAGLVADLEPRVIGRCAAAPTTSPNGDVTQTTTNGLVVIRRSDGRTAFTDGYRTWVDGSDGVQRRLNGERFDWEAAKPGAVVTPIAPVRPAGAVTLDECVAPGRATDTARRAPCASLLEAVIEATARRATGPVLRAGDHVVLVDRHGAPVGYVDDGTNALGYDGTPLFYVVRDLVFTYPGDFLGWVVDGMIRDRDGNAVLALAGQARPLAVPEPSRAPARRLPPRGTREIPALQPPSTTAWARPRAFGIGP